jgi:hypothetical protein
MTVYLRKATASQEVPLGQMLSTTDGLTAFTTQIEVTDIHIWKAGATTLAHSSAVATHISNGIFYTVLDATDTDTAGPLVIFSQPTGALPARLECIVLNAAVYDAWFSTGFLPVDMVNVHGTALTETATQLAAGISKFFDVASPTSTMNLITAVTTCTTNTDMRGTDSAALATALATVDGIVDDILLDTAVIGALGAGLTGIPWNAAWDAEVESECKDALDAYDPPTNTEFEARSIPAADYVVVGDTIARVTLVDTCTVNSDMRGTDSAGLATELAKVPKSDDTVSWNSTALAAINAEVDTALNTAIPASNTATSVNDILLDVLTLAAINAEVDTALNTAIPASNTATSVNDILLDVLTLAAINAEVDTALNTAIPGSPTSDSINERVKAIDVLSEASGSGDLAAILADTNELQGEWVNGGRLDLILDAASAPSAATVADAVWNEVLHTDHEVSGSASVLLQGIDTVTTDLHTDVADIHTDVADLHTDIATAITDIGDVHATDLPAVMTMLTDIHGTDLPAVKVDTAAILEDTGTTLDALIKRILGLTQENFRISSPVFSVTGKMTSCTTKIYPTATDCTNDTNVLATYTTTATYDGDDNLATYKVVKA